MNPESNYNSERNSSIDKVIARTPEEKKEAENSFAETFSDQKWSISRMATVNSLANA